MDFHSAMETFAEAWVAANTQTSASSENAVGSTPLFATHSSRLSDVTVGRMAITSSQSLLPTSHAHDQEKLLAPPAEVSDKLHLSTSQLSNKEPVKSIPVHCIVERSTECQSSGVVKSSSVEMDSYAIIPVNTLFVDIVHIALDKLGYLPCDAVGAKGAIHIKNWNPLPFSSITVDETKTVGDILSLLTTVATLQIRLVGHPKLSAVDNIKTKLLQLLLLKSQALLTNSGCPIEKSILDSLANGNRPNCLPEDATKMFDRWFDEQLGKSIVPRASDHSLTPLQTVRTDSQSSSEEKTPPMTINASNDAQFIPRPVMHKTRMRISFDPELELPKLHQWFAQNQHPSRYQIQQYVNELNAFETRKGRKPLDVNNLVYWFKNARAAYKRALGMYGSQVSNTLSDDSCLEENIDVEMTEQKTEKTSDDEVSSLGKGHTNKVADQTHRPPGVGHYDGDEISDDEGSDSDDDRRSELAKVNSVEDEAKLADTLNSDIKKEIHGTSSSPEPNMHFLNGNCMSDIQTNSCTSPHEFHPYNSSLAIPFCTRFSPKGPPTMVSCSTAELAYKSSTYSSHYRSLPSSLVIRNMVQNGQISSDHIEERRSKRNRIFIDPITEIPRLEQWFGITTHPSHEEIEHFTRELNSFEYRQRFPKLEPKNVQFWFKNRRARAKKLRLSQDITV